VGEWREHTTMAVAAHRYAWVVVYTFVGHMTIRQTQTRNLYADAATPSFAFVETPSIDRCSGISLSKKS
jgi:hypothetical protein